MIPDQFPAPLFHCASSFLMLSGNSMLSPLDFEQQYVEMLG